MHLPDLLTVVDTIEQPAFFAHTEMASTWTAVAPILSQTPEIQALCAQKENSVPLLLKRYFAKAEHMPERVRLVYFVAFGALQNEATIDPIMSYLRACQGVPGEEMLSPWHPLLHAIRALSIISNGLILMPGTMEIVLDFEGFLNRVEEWNERRADGLPESVPLV